MTALDPQHDDLVRQHRFAWDCFVRTREDRELSKFFYSLAADIFNEIQALTTL
jgi:hypothetical protein